MSKSVTFVFEGEQAGKVAEYFYHWYVDGGLQDQVEETLSENLEADIETTAIDNETLTVTLGCK